MKPKPQPQKELAIIFHYKPARHIVFAASPDALEDCKEFGHISQSEPPTFSLLVDPRYDFQEVLNYMENYG